MILPEALKYKFEETLVAYEEVNEMPYITSIEEIGIEKGLKQGVEQGALQTLRKSVLQVLRLRFGEVPPSLVETINQIDDPARLEKLHERAVLANALADFEESLS